MGTSLKHPHQRSKKCWPSDEQATDSSGAVSRNQRHTFTHTQESSRNRQQHTHTHKHTSATFKFLSSLPSSKTGDRGGGGGLQVVGVHVGLSAGEAGKA